MNIRLTALFIGWIAVYAESGFGQSSFGFQNIASGLDAPVFDGGGNRLVGTNFLAMMYGGPSPDTLAPAVGDHQGLAPAPFTYIVNGLAGYFRDGVAVIPNVICGGSAWLQVRAWDARLGSTYDEVVTLGVGGYGESNLFQAQGGNPCIPIPTVPGVLIGLQSFNLLPEVPEPKSFLLLFLGLVLLLVRRSRRE